jgi:cell division protein FtsI (penicillin-binding protein 3)
MVMMVVIEEPQGREFGGTVAAPVFQAVAKRSLPLLGIFLPPEKEKKRKKEVISIGDDDVTAQILPEESAKKDALPEGYVVVPNVVGLNLQQATFVAHNAGLDIQFSGESNDIITQQSPKPGDVQLFGTVISLSLKDSTKDVSAEDEIEED